MKKLMNTTVKNVQLQIYYMTITILWLMLLLYIKIKEGNDVTEDININRICIPQLINIKKRNI